MQRPPSKPDKKKKTLKPFGVFVPVKPTIKPEIDSAPHESKLFLFNKPEFKDELKAALEHKAVRDKLNRAIQRDTELNLTKKPPWRIQPENSIPKEFWIDGTAPVPFSSRTKLREETVQAIEAEKIELSKIKKKYETILQEETKDSVNVSVIGAGPGGLMALAFMLKSGASINATVYEQRGDAFSRLSQLIAYPGLRLEEIVDKQTYNELITHGGTLHMVGDEDTEYENYYGFCAPTAVWQKALKHMLERNGVKFIHAKKTPAELAGEADIVVSARGAHSPDAVSNPRGRHSYGRQIGCIMQSFYPADSGLLKPVKTDEPPWITQEIGESGHGFTVTTHNTLSKSFARRRDVHLLVIDDTAEMKEWGQLGYYKLRPAPWEHQHPEEKVSWNSITKSELIDILEIQINRLNRKKASSEEQSIIDAEINRIKDLKNSLKIGQKIIFSECGVVMRRGGEYDERILKDFHPQFITLADRFVKHPRRLADPVNYKPLQKEGTKIQTEVARLGDEIATPHWATGRGFYGAVCESEYLQPFIKTLQDVKKLENAAADFSLTGEKGQELQEDAEKMRLHARRMYDYAVSDIADQIVLVSTVVDLLPFYNEKEPEPEQKLRDETIIEHKKQP